MLFDTATVECPRSLYSDELKELVQDFAKSRIFGQFGASLYGPDLSSWPARTVEAFLIMHRESERVDSLLARSERQIQQEQQRR